MIIPQCCCGVLWTGGETSYDFALMWKWVDNGCFFHFRMSWSFKGGRRHYESLSTYMCFYRLKMPSHHNLVTVLVCMCMLVRRKRWENSDIACLYIWRTTVPGERTIYLQTIEFSRYLITKHLWSTYACIDITVRRQQSPLSCLQRFPPLLKHTATIRIGPKYSRILSSDSGDEIKIAHFLSPCKEQINFPRLGRDIFLPLGFPVSGTAAWLAAGGGSRPDCTPRRRTVTSAAASLFAPRYENCHHLPFPNTSQKEKK